MQEIIVVDLDGTLIKNDTFYLSLYKLLINHPLKILALPFWLLKGFGHFKEQIATQVEINPHSLQYNMSLITWLKTKHKEGAKIILATGCSDSVAQKIAKNIDFISAVHATKDGINLTGKNKARLLNQLYGKKQYIYAGNSRVDINVWSNSKAAILVNASKKTAKLTKKIVAVINVF